MSLMRAISLWESSKIIYLFLRSQLRASIYFCRSSFLTAVLLRSQSSAFNWSVLSICSLALMSLISFNLLISLQFSALYCLSASYSLSNSTSLILMSQFKSVFLHASSFNLFVSQCLSSNSLLDLQSSSYNSKPYFYLQINYIFPNPIMLTYLIASTSNRQFNVSSQLFRPCPYQVQLYSQYRV